MYAISLDRKTVKDIVRPYEGKNNLLALSLFLFDYCLWFVGQYVTVVATSEFKIFGSFISAIAMGRLFIIGHDACHGAFTSSKKLNRWIGYFSFFPEITTYQGWVHAHNISHHSYTNLATIDGWKPLSKKDYLSLSKFQQMQYKFFRSPIGVFFYFIITMWTKQHYFPNKNNKFMFEKTYLVQFFMVTAFVAVWTSTLYFLSELTNQPFLLLLLMAVGLPFLLIFMALSFIVYLQHTHPTVRWYDNHQEWINSLPHVTATVHIKFPVWIGFLLHHMMEHPAHHLNANIPCYNLRAAQAKLEETLPEHIVVQDFSWKWYLECTRICKLYDFEKHEWVGFPE